jgi:Alr-MurF fusion protein
MINFSQLEKLTGGELISFYRDSPITRLLTDSRKAFASPGALFFAIKGERHDGHQYLLDLYDHGIRQFVVEELPPYSLAQSNIIKVASSVEALQAIVAEHRRSFSIPVIGVTGSNGKTIIKEWLFQMLSPFEIVVKNPGSYNSQIGVPLSVWELQRQHTLAIFEAGISRPGEMQKLQEIIRPSIGIFSNIGPAHDEGFSSRKEKIAEKLKLFKDVQHLIYCADHAELHEVISSTSIPCITWGRKGDIAIETLSKNRVILHWKGRQFRLLIPFDDHAGRENCLHAVCTMIVLGFSEEKIQAGVNTLRKVPMRLELKEGVNQCQIIDDTYNNDLAGLEISLQFLSHQQQKKKKSLILSDILESGLSENDLVRKLEELVEKYGINRFIGIGPALSNNEDVFPEDSSFYADTEDFLKNIDPNTFHNEVILVKGARPFQFERIVHKLQRKVHGTVMEIDLGALVHNFNYIKSTLNRSTKVMVMVKAFAYGSGSNEIANLLQFHQADYLGVAYADEGIELRKNNITLPIMVMNPSEESFDQLLQFQLEPEIYNMRILGAFVNFLRGRNAKVHIKIDTGMHRLGFEESDLPALISILSTNKNLTVASVFSHMAGADEEQHDEFSRKQAHQFKRLADRITSSLTYKPLYHILNSPGILRLPEFQFDMVRLGIGLYGIDPTGNEDTALKPVATLKTVISQIRHVPKGESIGYGRRGRADTDLTIATIAIGYADGFSRAFSRGVGNVLIKGRKAPVIGNVCMDMSMIDITGIPASEGDEVIVFGKDHPITEVAASISTIPYEILTNTSERVKRIFVAEGL